MTGSGFDELTAAFDARRRLEDADLALGRARRKLSMLQKSHNAPHAPDAVAAARKAVIAATKRVMNAKIACETAR